MEKIKRYHSDEFYVTKLNNLKEKEHIFRTMQPKTRLNQN